MYVIGLGLDAKLETAVIWTFINIRIRRECVTSRCVYISGKTFQCIFPKENILTFCFFNFHYK